MANALVPFIAASTGLGFHKVKGQGWQFGLFTLLGFESAGIIATSDDEMTDRLKNRKRFEDRPKIAAAKKTAADWRRIIANSK